MVDHSGKNFPQPSLETESYWQGCRNHKLLIQKCSACDQYQFYPRHHVYQLYEQRSRMGTSNGSGKGC